MSSRSTSWIVIDASVVVRSLVTSGDTPRVLELLDGWNKASRQLVAPQLLIPEVVSALRQIVRARHITPAEADSAVENLLALRIEYVPPDVALCQSALRWAARLDQVRAYDALYVALAEREGAELWSADERLVRALQGAGGVRAFSVRSG